MLQATLPVRGTDRYGSGAYLASRKDSEGNTYQHEGTDFLCAPGTEIHAARCGRVTHVGYPYADDLSYRYVEVTDLHGFAARYFYVEPMVSKGQVVERGEVIGTSQSLDPRYEGISEHIHFEVIKDGRHYDPIDYLGP